MRDERGYYHDLKDIAEMGPEWASGCDKCSYGLVSSPPLTGVVELYLERCVQALEHELEFCECNAGKYYRVSLWNRIKRLNKEAEHYEKLRHFGTLKDCVDPDLEIAKRKVMAMREAHVPTVHFEEVAA